MPGFFSRFAELVSDVIDGAGELLDRALGREEPEAPAAEEPVEVPTVIDAVDGGGAEAREELAEQLGPVSDEGRTTEDIEAEQWIAFFEAHPDQIPPDFIDALAELFDEYGLDDDLYSTVEHDAPEGDT